MIHLDFLPTAMLNKIDAILQITGVFKEQNFPFENCLAENLTTQNHNIIEYLSWRGLIRIIKFTSMCKAVSETVQAMNEAKLCSCVKQSFLLLGSTR